MKTISKQEAKLLQYLHQKNQSFFKNAQALEAYPSLSKNRIEKILSNMTQKGLITRLKEGIYCLIPYDQDAENFMPDWHSLAPNLVKNNDYYIGYYAALQIHQLNTQPSLKEQIVVNRQIRPSVISIKGISFQFIYHNPKHFFGYQKTWINSFQQVNCSNIEKTIVDSLFKPAYAGGIVEVAKALYLAQEKINLATLFTYTQQFQSQAVIKRLGFLLELLEIKNPIVERLKEIRSPSIVTLDPQAPSIGKIVTRWSIQQNVDSFTIQSSIYT